MIKKYTVDGQLIFVTNGDYVNIIADLIIKLVNKNITGIVNVGTDIKTWFELTKDEFKTVPGTKPLDAPYNITMNLSKLKDALKEPNK